MNTHPTPFRSAGYALMMVIMFSGLAMLLMAGVLSWSSSNAIQTERHNQYYSSLAAAEAATEKVLAHIAYDFQQSGESRVVANLESYRNMVPLVNEHPFWQYFTFEDGQGNPGHTYVNGSTSWSYQALNSQFEGLYGFASIFRIISNATQNNTAYSNITAAVRQEIQVATIPLFQFAIFYNLDLEIEPGAAMVVRGRVHGNADLYTMPESSTALTFSKDVTSVGNIINGEHPSDPRSRSSTFNIAYQSLKQSKVSSMSMPIGTNNTPDAIYEIMGLPAAGEDANSPMGKQRYYNRSDLVILVSNNVLTAKSGPAFSAVTVPNNQVTNFVRTNVTFWNSREGKNIQTTEIDVSKLRSWSSTNTNLRSVLGNRDVQVVYVGDFRTQTSTTESGVRLVNGQTLPNTGLTVATPNPLYIKGDYNADAAYLGTTNTTTTKPASVISDAITILSGSWDDTKSSQALANRVAANTTVNTAIISGIVPTTSSSYSGGVENFLRFLETWSGKSSTYNGSMVVMFPSKKATGLWRGTGGTIGIYDAPTRNWNFDLNFLNAAKLPPGTPGVRAVIRGSWQNVAKNTVN